MNAGEKKIKAKIIFLASNYVISKKGPGKEVKKFTGSLVILLPSFGSDQSTEPLT